MSLYALQVSLKFFLDHAMWIRLLDDVVEKLVKSVEFGIVIIEADEIK